MGKMVLPQVFVVGRTTICEDGLNEFLAASSNQDFAETWEDAVAHGMSDIDILTSVGAKLCYNSLTLDKNSNVTRIRDIKSNLVTTHQHGHGSVWEHGSIVFIVYNCSRVFTHELVRHRTGTAFSQTSGRFCRLDSIDFVHDPILDAAEDIVAEALEYLEDVVQRIERRVGLQVQDCEGEWGNNAAMPMDEKKRLTSAIRRIAPNGQANNIMFTANMRALRHILQARTAAAAEWEIRYVFGLLFSAIHSMVPGAFTDAEVTHVRDLQQITGMKTTPY